jgi:hypothetical protein
MTALRVIWFVTILLCVVVPATTASDVQLADLPDVVRKTIVEQTQHATILHLRKTSRGGQELYEAQTNSGSSGKTILVDQRGAVLEIEEAISLSHVPPEARRAIESSVANGKIKKLESIKLPSGVIAAYRVQFERNGKQSELRLSPDGRLVPE